MSKSWYWILPLLGLLAACAKPKPRAASSQIYRPVDYSASQDFVALAAWLKGHCGHKGEGYAEVVAATQNAYKQRFLLVLKDARASDSALDYWAAGSDASEGKIQRLRQQPLIGTNRVGLLDDSLNLILEPRFTGIYNIGHIAPDWMVLGEGKLLGLFNPRTKQLIEPQFEQIYPYPHAPQRVLAQIKQNGRYGWLDMAGKAWFEVGSYPDARLFRSPLDSDLCRQWGYSLQAKHNLPFISGVCGDGQIEGQGYWEASIHLPTYLDEEFDFRESSLSLAAEDDGYGTVKEGGMRLSDTAQKAGWTVRLGSFFQAGLQMREFHRTDYRVLSRKADTMVITGIEKYSGGFCPDELHSQAIRFVPGTVLIEVKHQKGLEGYVEAPTYAYYRLDAQTGEAVLLPSQRRFPSTQWVRLDERYFKGCFIQKKPEGGHVQRACLSEADLDEMRDEILAGYGQIFKDPQQQAFFEAKAWYEGKSDNARALLSETEKHNLQVIERFKQQSLKSPACAQEKAVIDPRMF